MIRFFLILLIIVAVTFIGMWLIYRNVENFLRNIFPRQYQNAGQGKNAQNKVVYEKDNIIVLKGEAKTENENDSEQSVREH